MGMAPADFAPTARCAVPAQSGATGWNAECQAAANSMHLFLLFGLKLLLSRDDLVQRPDIKAIDHLLAHGQVRLGPRCRCNTFLNCFVLAGKQITGMFLTVH